MRRVNTRGGNVSGPGHCRAKSVMRPLRNRRLPERGNGAAVIEARALPPLLENEIEGRGGNFRGLARVEGRFRINNPWAVGKENNGRFRVRKYETGDRFEGLCCGARLSTGSQGKLARIEHHASPEWRQGDYQAR